MFALKFRKNLISFFKIPSVHIRQISGHRRKLTESYTFQNGDLQLINSTMGQLVNEAADKSGDRIAFISAHQNISKTYTEFRKETEKLASALVNLGLRKGDRVAICCPNSYEWSVVQFATAQAGIIMANINPASQSNEIEYCLRKIGCKALIIWDVLKTQNFYEILCKMLPNLSNSSPGKPIDNKLPNLETIIMLSDESKPGVLRFADVFESGNKESSILLSDIQKKIRFDDPISIQFTSGTTGAPKGALLSHHNIVNNALIFSERLGFFEQKTILCCQVPLFHCFGSVGGSLGSLVCHSTCVYPCAGFNASESLKAIEKYQCTSVYGTPTMYVDMLSVSKTQKSNISSLKQAVVGGSGPTTFLLDDMKTNLGLTDLHIAYGSTEVSPLSAMNERNEDFEMVRDKFMKPIEFIEVKIVDGSNQVVPVGSKGEICIRGHSVFKGYWDDAEKTAEAVKENWYHSGDLATMNEDGYVKIVGRMKDMIIRGGENIDPLEIEGFLFTHPAILEVNVVGVPDKRMDEEICAWITLKEGFELSEEDVKSFCKGQISHFKIPRYVMFTKDLPRTASGKIVKYKLKEDSIKILNL